MKGVRNILGCAVSGWGSDYEGRPFRVLGLGDGAKSVMQVIEMYHFQGFQEGRLDQEEVFV